MNSPTLPKFCRGLVPCFLLGQVHALTLGFERVTDNAFEDIAPDIILTVTDLGAGMAQFELSRGDTFLGFLRNVYFEDVDDHVIGASFDPVASSASVAFSDPSNPDQPPGVAGFVTKYSFDADIPNAHGNSIGPNEVGAFMVNYVGNYDDLEQSILDGQTRVAVHAQGLDIHANESDSFINLPTGVDPLPEPATWLLTMLGFLGLLKRHRAGTGSSSRQNSPGEWWPPEVQAKNC